MSGVPEEGAAGISDRALLRDNVRGAAARAGNQRAKRIGAKNAVRFGARQQLRLLLR
jgi:hypothetical protein